MRRFYKLVLASGLAFGIGTTASAETLADALISAYRESYLIEQNQAVLRAADEGVAQAVGALRPVIEYTTQFNLQRSRSNSIFSSSGFTQDFQQSLGLTASMNVYDFGRGDLGINFRKRFGNRLHHQGDCFLPVV